MPNVAYPNSTTRNTKVASLIFWPVFDLPQTSSIRSYTLAVHPYFYAYCIWLRCCRGFELTAGLKDLLRPQRLEAKDPNRQITNSAQQPPFYFLFFEMPGKKYLVQTWIFFAVHQSLQYFCAFLLHMFKLNCNKESFTFRTKCFDENSDGDKTAVSCSNTSVSNHWRDGPAERANTKNLKQKLRYFSGSKRGTNIFIDWFEKWLTFIT